MGAVIDKHLLDRHIGIGKDRVGRLLVADRPFKDVVGVFARPVRPDHLVLNVFTQHRRIRQHGFERVHDHRQGIVDHINQFGRVRGDVTVFSDDEGHFLILEQHLVLGQNRLHIARQRRHVVQAKGFQICRCQNGHHAGQGLGAAGVDADDPGMRMRRAHEIAKQHAWQFHVIDVVALALGKADVFHALALASHALKFLDPLGAVGFHICWLVHSAAS